MLIFYMASNENEIHMCAEIEVQFKKTEDNPADF